MMATVLVNPVVSLTIGVIALIGLWWQWIGLHSPSVPPSRRRIRRITTMMMLLAIPLIVTSMSFIDRSTHPREFVIAWSLVFLMMMLIIVGALFDVLNSVRLHQQHLDREVADAAGDLAQATRMHDDSASRKADASR